MNLPQVAYEYLIASNIRVSKDWLEQRIKSHPDHPALVSLTDTLDELGLKHKAVRAEEKHIAQFSFPFLAQTPRAVGGFEIVPSMEYYKAHKESFLNRWEGIAVMLDPRQKTQNKEHEMYLEKESKVESILKVTIFIGLFIFLFFQTSHFNFLLFVFTLLSILGITICALIILHKIGKDNIITKQLCSSENFHSCDLVLNSNIAEFIKGVDFGDVGLMYFSTLLIFSTFTSITNNATDAFSLMFFPFIFAVAFTFFSLYYQWRIVKAWCKMCLMTVGIIWLQTTIISFSLTNSKQLLPVLWTHSILQLLLAVSISSLWLIIKPLINNRNIERANAVDLLRWKRNPEIFQILLFKQPYTDTFIINNPVICGDTNAPLQFTIISNPFCRPCAAAHLQLEELYNTYPNIVSFKVIFLVEAADDKEDRRIIAINKIINAIITTRNVDRILHDWFEKMVLEDFVQKYPCVNVDNDTLNVLHEYQQWVENNNISYTPTVYLNGYAIPKQYKLEDISSFVLDLRDSLSKNSQNIILT